MSADLTRARPTKGSPKERSSTSINLRIPTRTRELIDAAASATGKTRTEFVLDSAREQAIDVLLDQRFFVLNDQEFDAFKAILDNPAPPPEKLRQLMQRKAPWER